MVQNTGGAAPYIYVSTRLRVRKAKLLAPEEYQRMLNMSLPEIIRLIGETEYQKEVDELGTSFEGIDLIEVALSWNLAKEYQRVIDLAPGALKEFTMAYLRRWDIYNVLTILRGKMQGLKEGKITRTDYLREDAPFIWREFISRSRRLENAYETDKWPKRPSGLCNGWCPAKGHCEHWRPKR